MNFGQYNNYLCKIPVKNDSVDDNFYNFYNDIEFDFMGNKKTQIQTISMKSPDQYECPLVTTKSGDLYCPEFLIYNDHPDDYFGIMKKQYENYGDSIQYLKNLRTQFFSDTNIAIIQKFIQKQILSKTNIKIPIQNEAHLIDYMNGIFQDYGNAKKISIEDQIALLDKIVVDKCCAEIILAIRQQQRHNNSYNKNPLPLSLPVATNVTGLRTLINY